MERGVWGTAALRGSDNYLRRSLGRFCKRNYACHPWDPARMGSIGPTGDPRDLSGSRKGPGQLRMFSRSPIEGPGPRTAPSLECCGPAAPHVPA